MKYFVSFVIVGRAAAYDGFVLKLELPCRLRVSVVSYCGLLAFDARDAWPQTGGSLIESGEDGLCHYCKPCFVNAKPLIPSNRIVLPFPEEIIISFQELINEIIPNSIPSLSSKVFAMIQLIFLINFTFMEKIILFVPEFNYK